MKNIKGVMKYSCYLLVNTTTDKFELEYRAE